MCRNLPDINSLGICFLPAVDTRYNVKFSMRRTTQEVINLCKLSKICFVDAACAALGTIPKFKLLSLVDGFRSNGECVAVRSG